MATDKRDFKVSFFFFFSNTLRGIFFYGLRDLPHTVYYMYVA